jgi:nucleoside-diphosphate-sugar epimerase
MPRAFRTVIMSEAFPRILVDFAIVQVSAILALVVAMIFRTEAEANMTAAAFAALLRTYYMNVFLPLSFVFPVVYSMSGFYTNSRAFRTEYKWRAILRGTLNATLIYLFVSFQITRTGTLPRSAILAFAGMVAAGTVGVRWLKTRIVDRAVTLAGTAAKPEASAPVLVMGGAGYIGSIVVRKLLEAGRRVRILDSLVYGASPIREILTDPNVELIVGDCRNIQNMVSAVSGVDSIIHLAAIVGDPACEQDRRAALEINYAATRMLIEIARGFGVRRLIFASSCSVYGSSDMLMTEHSETKPISLYAQTKLDSERALLQSRSDSFHPTILRFATVFGNSYRPRFDLVVNLLTAKAHQEQVIRVYNGEQWRPFIHVTDVARAILQVLNAPEALVSGQIFNVGDSRLNFTLSQTAEKIREAFPGTRIEHVENSDRRNYQVSFDKIRNRLGFRAKMQLEDGIAELKHALDQGAISDYRDIVYHNQRFLESMGAPVASTTLDSEVMAAFSRPATEREMVAQALI